MGPGTSGPSLAVLLALVAASLLLFVAGLVLRRRGQLTSRFAATGWALLSLVPLFGAGAIFFLSHQVQRAEGELPSGYDDQFPQRDPVNAGNQSQ